VTCVTAHPHETEIRLMGVRSRRGSVNTLVGIMQQVEEGLELPTHGEERSTPGLAQGGALDAFNRVGDLTRGLSRS
jgi:hypothetical protein